MNKQKTNKKKTSKVMPDVTEYIRLYKEENYPLREVAKHFKVSVSTIYNAMTTAGFSEFRAKSSRCSNKRMSMEQQAITLFHVEAYE
jgi:transposase